MKIKLHFQIYSLSSSLVIHDIDRIMDFEYQIGNLKIKIYTTRITNEKLVKITKEVIIE